jgi:tellurite resistance protein TehA-like permease
MFGIPGILHFAVTAAIAGIVIYALVLVIIFLRLRIRELKTTQPLEPGNPENHP